MLEMHNISKIFRADLIETHALRDFSLTVTAGEFVAVTGPSGSGKTTFLNVAGLLESFDTGKYLLDGADVSHLSDDERSRLRNEKIGFIFQGFNLIPDLNIYDNVDVPLRYRRMSAKERHERITSALDLVGLSSRTRHMPSQLSGGQQQRAAIARALAGDPKFLLADEPTGNLDSLMARQVLDLLEQINEMGTTIIMVTHDIELARRAQRNVHVVDGQISDFKSYEARATETFAAAGALSADRENTNMLSYYFRLALASFRRTPGITALMVLAIGVGVGACVVTQTLYHAMSGNPIWWKSDQLYAVTLDNWDPNEPADNARPTLPPDQMTFRDAEAIVWHSDIPKRKTIMYRVSGILSGEGLRGPIDPVNAPTRVTTGDFFAMFDVPFLYGHGWDAKADSGPEPVIVISRKLNEKVFGGQNSVGRTIRWNDNEFRIVGVLDSWEPRPKYYDLNNNHFSPPEDAYIPWKWGETLELTSAGSSNCWKLFEDTSFTGYKNSDCVWIQAWVELPTAAARERMQASLDAYTDREKKAGRFQRPRNNRLTDVAHWLKDQRVVTSDNRVLVGLAFSFLTVCLINTIGLLLAKFLNAAPLSGVRRALGASRKDLFAQHMVEVSAIAAGGAVLGLAFGALGLLGIRALYTVPKGFGGADALRSLAHMDLSSYGTSVVLAVFATLVCGLYPAWRVGRLQPASYIRNQ